MLLSKLKVVAVLLVAAALVSAGVGTLPNRARAREQPVPEKETKATPPDEDRAPQKERPTPRQLIRAVTTPLPGEPERDPVLPVMSSSVRGEVGNEILGSQAVRAAYDKLDARKRNTIWFEGVAELEKAKAVWCLTSCLCHPHPDVQIHALRALRRLGDRRAVPFLLLYAEYMAILVAGSENATLHGIIHQETARALSSLTDVRITLHRGQDPEGLLRGVRRWRKWLCENEDGRAGKQDVGKDRGWSLTATANTWEGRPYVKVFLVGPGNVSRELTDRCVPAFLLERMCSVQVDGKEAFVRSRGDIMGAGFKKSRKSVEGKTLLGALVLDGPTAAHFDSYTPTVSLLVIGKDRQRAAVPLPPGKHTLTIQLESSWAEQLGSRVAPATVEIEIPTAPR